MFGLSPQRSVPEDYRAFANLPVTRYSVGPASEAIAVHVAGQLTGGRVPLLCIPGYQRNMSDFADFATQFRLRFGEDWPLVLVDLKGRGRSSDRADKSRYISTVDAAELIEVVAALAVDGVILVGQGYGGQVAMALAVDRPNLVAGAVLLDAGPVSDPRGLVRLRNNLKDLEGFEHDDVLVAQWPMYEALRDVPLLLMRTQLTEQLRRETFEEMMRRRPDAEGYILEGQGSPALLGTAEDVEPIAEFVRRVVKRKTPRAA